MAREASPIAKTTTVLDFLEAVGVTAEFVRLPEEGDDNPDKYRIQRIRLSRAMWEDLGSPEKITLTVEPGDMLNSDQEEDDNDLT